MCRLEKIDFVVVVALVLLAALFASGVSAYAKGTATVGVGWVNIELQSKSGSLEVEGLPEFTSIRNCLGLLFVPALMILLHLLWNTI